MKLNDERICYRAFKDRVYISTTWFKDYMFEGVSANIFNCLIKGMEKKDIISLLKQRYDVELKTLIKDVDIFINELINYNILLDDSHIKQNHYITLKNKTKDVSYSNLLDISKNDEIPIKIDYHITYKCNQKCKHCYAADNIYANNEEMDLSQIYNMLDQLNELGTFYLRITGGEPFCHPHIKEVLKYASDKNFAISIVSNGTMIDDEMIEFLSSIKLRDLTFSIFSIDNDVHDSFTKLKGSKDRLLDVIKKCKNVSLPIKLTCVVNKENFKYIDSLNQFAKNEKIHLTLTTMITPQMNGGLNPTNYRLNENELIEFNRKYNIKSSPLKCTAGTKMQISPSGLVQPCLFIEDVIGDIKKEYLRDIWAKMVKKDYSLYKCVPEECKECDRNEYCHRCPGVCKIEMGRPDCCSYTAKWQSSGYVIEEMESK